MHWWSTQKQRQSLALYFTKDRRYQGKTDMGSCARIEGSKSSKGKSAREQKYGGEDRREKRTTSFSRDLCQADQ